MQRMPFVGGNWKMNTTADVAKSLARSVAEASGTHPGVETAIYPPFPYLLGVREVLEAASSPVRLGAQNLWDKPNGAFTGEVSAEMLKDCGVSTVLIGHSERRHVIGETDELINRKVIHALEAGLQVVLCIGETLAQREDGITDMINKRQLDLGLGGVNPEAMSQVVIAYEPVWAIGTGRTASPEDAQNAHEAIRGVLANLFDAQVSVQTRVIYGGSVKASNAAELFSCPDIDGGLIGGASLKPDEFVKIVEAGSHQVA